jgi:hypothetical protein
MRKLRAGSDAAQQRSGVAPARTGWALLSGVTPSTPALRARVAARGPEAGSPRLSRSCPRSRPEPEPRPLSDGGAAPGNGALAALRSGQPDALRTPPPTPRDHPAHPTATAESAAPGLTLGHPCTDRTGETGDVDGSPSGHGDPSQASTGWPAGATNLRSG